MRNLKKVLALVLAMAMSLSLAVTAGAAFNDQDKIVNTEAVDMCVALNIINGRTDGSFDPAGNVTRAEMAKMICIVLNGGKEPITATKADPTFADIAGHWAEGYIEYCFAKGVVAGKSATEFAPNAGVTGTEAAKMLLVALGYNADVEKMVGANWALYTNVLANQDGLYEDLESMDPGAALSRDNAAQMIWNTLNANIITKTSSIENGSIRETYGKDYNTDLLKAKYNTAEPVVGDLDWTNYNSDKGEWTYSVDGKPFVTDEDYTDLYMQNVKVIYKGKDVYGIFANDASVVVSGVIGDMETKQPVDGEIEIDGVKYKAETIKYYAFGEGEKSADCDAYAFEAIDNDDNGKIDRVVFYPFAVTEINYVGSKTFNTADVVDSKASFTTENVDIYEGFAKDDNVIVFNAVNTPCGKTQFQKAEVISGEVTMQNGSDWTIGGEVYTAIGTISALELGVEVDAVVVNGYIFSAEKTSASVSMADIVYVDGIATETDKYDSSKSTTTIRAIFTDGTTAEVVLSDDTKASVQKGGLYAFEIEDDEYVLSDISVDKVETGKKVEGDFDAKYTVAKAGDDRIGDYRANDDAVIFVTDKEGDVVVVTGADVKAWAKETAAAGTVYTNTTNGYDYVALAALTVTTNDAPGASANDVYGYVVDYLGETKEGNDKYKTYSVWTGSDNETIKVKSGDSDGAKKGDFIKVDEGVIDVLDTADAVVGFDAKTVKFNTANELKIVDATKFIYVNTDDVAGAEGGALAKATNHNTSGTYEGNVVVVVNPDDATELAVLFIDVNNELKGALATAGDF